MWRFIFVGFFLTVKCKNVFEPDIYWRDYNKIIPEDAVDFGTGLYVGICILDGYLVPGTIYPDTGNFVTAWYGYRKEKKEDIKIMCSQNPSRFKWAYYDGNDLPSHLVRIKNDQLGLTYYVGRALHENEWRIGKKDHRTFLHIFSNNGKAYYPYQYEILTYDISTPHMNKTVTNNIQPNIIEVSTKNQSVTSNNDHFISAIAAELDLLPEKTRDLIKTAIWGVIFTYKYENITNV